MKQSVLMAVILALGLAQGCATSGQGEAGSAEGEAPRMRTPAPGAPVEGAEAGAMGPDEGAAASVEANGGGYRFKPGDTLMITITGVPGPRDPIQDVVDESGYIGMPFIGQVQAGGLTSSELETELTDRYVPGYYKNATISVFDPQRGYYIRGEVRSPGRVQMVPGMTIMQAVATVGGYTEYANPKRVRILRGDETIRVNLKDIEKNPEKDIPLEARDVIIVPRSFF